MKNLGFITNHRLIVSLAAASLLFTSAYAADNSWKPVGGKIMTRWAKDVKPGKAWKEYPRPQFERQDWENLNGLWSYAVTAKDGAKPTEWSGKILVPFAIESALSGVGKPLEPEQALWYQRTIDVKPKAGNRTLLNFEAVDYQTTVWVNGKQVGEHTGGNTPFSFDVTDVLNKGENELVVRVWDGTSGSQLRGKQTLEPKGIWYTRVSGIW